MATEREEGGDDVEVVTYDYALARWSDEEPAALADCPQCAGKGTVLLLVSAKPCAACGGTGKVSPAAGAEEPGDEPLYTTTTYIFDDNDELIDVIDGGESEVDGNPKPEGNSKS